MRHHLGVWAALAASWVCACGGGGNDVSCGPGTVLSGQTCVPASSDGGSGDAAPDGGSGDAAPDGGAGCTSNGDCAQGDVCARATLTCVPASGALCGVPGTGTGSGKAGFPCQSDTDCGPSLTCVPDTTSGLDSTKTKYVPVHGTCFVACDPCKPSCAPAEECVALGGGQQGGFCQVGSLRGTGESCMGAVCAVGSCVGGTVPTCSGPLCVPAPDAGSLNDFSRGYPSADCAPGTACVLDLESIDGNVFSCHPGEIVGAGERCGVAGPAWCGASSCNGALGICYPACTNGTCAAGSTCSAGICVPDGAFGPGDPCVATANCVQGLQCTQGRCW